MATLLPSPPSSDDLSAVFFGQAAWTTTTTLPGLCRSSQRTSFQPCSPETPDDSSSRDSDLGPLTAAKDGSPSSAVTSSTSAASPGADAASPKSAYKHVPHREKPPHLVARRNARERRRVQAVNNAFSRLRKCVPIENRAKRLSKVKTLHKAIEYIHALQELLDDADKSVSSSAPDVVTEAYQEPALMQSNKENEASQRWITLENATCASESYPSYLNFYEEYPSTFAS
ncbi:achaete-scute complex protein T3 [Ixodes scapularis]|uniref:achaete-scute complex protein T3 n=1 Tax=Ixodes scapularis TaxID=6945 RepID=UPI001A9D805D|nr:achaete-scute complex protein T3 [Ixodes scapularis]